MKKYERPTVTFSCFDFENVVTTSGTTEPTALQQAQTTANNTYGEGKVISVTF